MQVIELENNGEAFSLASYDTERVAHGVTELKEKLKGYNRVTRISLKQNGSEINFKRSLAVKSTLSENLNCTLETLKDGICNRQLVDSHFSTEVSLTEVSSGVIEVNYVHENNHGLRVQNNCTFEKN